MKKVNQDAAAILNASAKGTKTLLRVIEERRQRGNTQKYTVELTSDQQQTLTQLDLATEAILKQRKTKAALIQDAFDYGLDELAAINKHDAGPAALRAVKQGRRA